MRKQRHPRPGPPQSGGDAAAAAARRLALIAAEVGATTRSRPDDETTREASPQAAAPEAAGSWLSDHTAPRLLGSWPAAEAPVAEPEPTDVVSKEAPDPDDEEPPELPQPGRHAARRRAQPMVRPVSLPMPFLGPTQLSVIAVVVAVAVGLSAWWVVRGRAADAPIPAAPTPVQPLLPSLSASEGAAPHTSATEEVVGAGDAGTVTVDVTGKVRKPGIVVLDSGSRVVDAVEAAGGAREGVDLSSLNLARVLVDGEQIVVGRPAAPLVSPSGTTTPTGPATLVNLNTASATELEALPEVGPVTAQSIVTWREQHGGFSTVDELLEVDGIGEVTMSQIAPYVTV